MARPKEAAPSREAQLVAAAILEVLAGLRSVPDAAASVGISPTRYYSIESRALAAMVAACERREPGRRERPDLEVGRMRKEVSRLERDLLRHQALARAATRAVGLGPPKAAKPKEGGKRRRRRPTVRALKEVRRLQSAPTLDGSEGAVATGAEVAPAAASS